MKKYDVTASFMTNVFMPSIEAENEEEAILKAEELLITDHSLEESQSEHPVWEINEINN